MSRLTRRWFRRLLALAACASMPRSLVAQSAPPPDPRAVQPERPTVATHAGTVAPGWLEIETGIQVDRDALRLHEITTPTVLKLGLAKRAQLGIGLTLVRPPDQPLGLGDVSLGIKWRLTEGAPLLGDFALLPSMKLPTGSTRRATGTGTTDFSILAISSYDAGPVAIDLNAGYTRRSGDGSDVPRDATVWTASFGGPVRGALGWVGELFGYPATRGRAGSEATTALLAGPTWLARPWLALDAGIIVPVQGPQSHSYYVGAVYNAGRVMPRLNAR